MSRYEGLDRYLAKLEEIKDAPKAGGIFVHAGCGPQIYPGWLNVDKYTTLPGILNVDMYDIPLPDSSVKAVYSSHSLEHLPIRKAQMALRNWFRLLEPGGILYLAVPDLEKTMQVLLSNDYTDEQKENWYLYTLFGYQVDPSKYSNSKELDLPEDPGQFHVSGFTQRMLNRHLTTIGFEIEEMFTYNGWDTWSIYVQARKKG